MVGVCPGAQGGREPRLSAYVSGRWFSKQLLGAPCVAPCRLSGPPPLQPLAPCPRGERRSRGRYPSAKPQCPPMCGAATGKVSRSCWSQTGSRGRGVELAAVSRSLPAHATPSRSFCEGSLMLQQGVSVRLGAARCAACVRWNWCAGIRMEGCAWGFSFAAYLGFLGGVRITPILKGAACSSAAGQGCRHRWARSQQPGSCPRHLPVVTLMQDPSCPVRCVKPPESLGFASVVSATAPASGSVGDGDLGGVATGSSGAASSAGRDPAL